MNTGSIVKACPLCSGMDVGFEGRSINDIALVTCPKCTFVYANIPDEAVLKANSSNGDIAATAYESNQTLLDYVWFNKVARRLAEGRDAGRVLDIGCGNGRLLREFTKLGWECHGVDASPWSEKYASDFGFQLHRGFIETTTQQIGGFDIAVSSSTLEHIARPLEHVQAIAGVVKRGGICYFCGIPNYGSLAVKMGLSSFYANEPPGHASFFNPRSLRILLQSAGVFGEIRARSYGIPELHRLYAVLRGGRRARKPTRPPGAVRTDRLTGAIVTAEKRSPNALRSLARLLVNVNYYGGILFGCGDKLEATAEK